MDCVPVCTNPTTGTRVTTYQSHPVGRYFFFLEYITAAVTTIMKRAQSAALQRGIFAYG
jgi:hypothetical protein